MSITSHLAWFFLQEYKFRPIVGDVCVIGRQTVNLTPTDAKILLKQEVGVDRAISHFQIDEDTRGAQLSDKPFITDRSFFEALPGVRFHSLDVSNYENADIIYYVTEPLPDYLENRFILFIMVVVLIIYLIQQLH